MVAIRFPTECPLALEASDPAVVIQHLHVPAEIGIQCQDNLDAGAVGAGQIAAVGAGPVERVDTAVMRRMVMHGHPLGTGCRK